MGRYREIYLVPLPARLRVEQRHGQPAAVEGAHHLGLARVRVKVRVRVRVRGRVRVRVRVRVWVRVRVRVRVSGPAGFAPRRPPPRRAAPARIARTRPTA